MAGEERGDSELRQRNQAEGNRALLPRPLRRCQWLTRGNGLSPGRQLPVGLGPGPGHGSRQTDRVERVLQSTHLNHIHCFVTARDPLPRASALHRPHGQRRAAQRAPWRQIRSCIRLRLRQLGHGLVRAPPLLLLLLLLPPAVAAEAEPASRAALPAAAVACLPYGDQQHGLERRDGVDGPPPAGTLQMAQVVASSCGYRVSVPQPCDLSPSSSPSKSSLA